jgi:DNA (cytosine-5)-methyltransferase 1
METNTTPAFRHDTTLKLGTHRGAPRVWIEGNHLAKAGFNPGDKFRAIFGPESVTLELAADGSRTISSRERDGKTLPIIDINAAELAQAFPQTERIAVRIQTHRIDITPSRVAAMQAARVLTALAFAGFAGGGLMTEAAKAAGFETVAANEVCEQYAEIYSANHGGQMLHSCMSEARLEDIAARHRIGLYHAGIPCEPFSEIRRNTGNAKADSSLAPEAHALGDGTFWALRAVDILNPHTAVFECVPRWLDSGAGLMARHVLTRLGYTVDARVIDSADFGAITRRKRAVMVATAFDAVNWPLASPASRTLADLLLPASDARCEWFTRETASKSWLFEHWEKQTAKGNGLKSAFIRYTDRTVGVIKKRYLNGQGDNPVVVHPTDETRFRWLTLDEIAAIMGLPAGYDLGTAKTIGGHVCGQGVEVDVFAQIFRAVTRQQVAAERLSA